MKSTIIQYLRKCSTVWSAAHILTCDTCRTMLVELLLNCSKSLRQYQYRSNFSDTHSFEFNDYSMFEKVLTVWSAVQHTFWHAIRVGPRYWNCCWTIHSNINKGINSICNINKDINSISTHYQIKTGYIQLFHFIIPTAENCTSTYSPEVNEQKLLNDGFAINCPHSKYKSK